VFAIKQDKAHRSIGGVLNELGGAFLEQFVLISDRLGRCWIFRWLEDEVRRNAMMRELDLSDHYLRDIGIEHRYVDLRTEDLVKRLRAGG
jgi:hypothetical protein